MAWEWKTKYVRWFWECSGNTDLDFKTQVDIGGETSSCHEAEMEIKPRREAGSLKGGIITEKEKHKETLILGKRVQEDNFVYVPEFWGKQNKLFLKSAHPTVNLDQSDLKSSKLLDDFTYMWNIGKLDKGSDNSKPWDIYERELEGKKSEREQGGGAFQGKMVVDSRCFGGGWWENTWGGNHTLSKI